MEKIKSLAPGKFTDFLNRAFSTSETFIDAGYGCIMPEGFLKFNERVKNLTVRDDDVFFCSYPRTGSTWLGEIIWLLSNDLDFEKARNVVHQVRHPLLEISCLYPDDKSTSKLIDQMLKGNSVDFIEAMTERRIIKTHLMWHLLPEQLTTNSKAKIVYTIRNPKDQVVSYYHYLLLAYQIKCTFEEFVETFMTNQMLYGSSAQHMSEYYKRRNQPNVLIVKYEDMNKDLPKVIQQCADHLEIERKLTQDDIDKLCDHVKFEKMEKNTSVNLEHLVFNDPIVAENIDREMYNKVKFIRKGQVGDWQNYFTPEINEKFDKWIEANITDGLTFEYV